MKKIKFTGFRLLFATGMATAVFNSCFEKVVSLEANQPPACTITAPQDGAQFGTDENVTVTVEADDADGTVAEVQLYVDNAVHGAVTALPYHFTLNAGELPAGEHTLKAVARDNTGATGLSAAVGITLNEPDPESPDFVTFAGGIIPATWQIPEWAVDAWVIDNTAGYDDLYSLKSTRSGTPLTTVKTGTADINFVEFYVQINNESDYGDINFYIDDIYMRRCYALSDRWIKYGFFLKEGLHTLRWESVGNANMDAVRFRKSNVTGWIGDEYQGGIIVYLDESGEHGIIAAPVDQSAGVQWYNGEYVDCGTVYGTWNFGYGKSNTEKIVEIQGAGNYAAKICHDLVLNGYDDWYLPSDGELYQIYINKDWIGGFTASGNYWSSSESYTSSMSFYYNNSTRDGAIMDKSAANRVRCIRDF